MARRDNALAQRYQPERQRGTNVKGGDEMKVALIIGAPVTLWVAWRALTQIAERYIIGRGE